MLVLREKNKRYLDMDLYNQCHEKSYFKHSPESRILYEALNPSNELQLSALQKNLSWKKNYMWQVGKNFEIRGEKVIARIIIFLSFGV